MLYWASHVPVRRRVKIVRRMGTRTGAIPTTSVTVMKSPAAPNAAVAVWKRQAAVLALMVTTATAQSATSMVTPTGAHRR